MQSELRTCLQMMQSLIASFHQPQTSSGLTERMIDLEDASQLISIATPSQRQQRALELLQRQMGVETSYSRRSETIQHSNLALDQQRHQLDDLLRRYRLARERLENDWPQLDHEESRSLPLLMLRESIEHEMAHVIARIRGRVA